jgi:hypothetical protein
MIHRTPDFTQSRRGLQNPSYHIRRNKVAKASHGKTWKAKHKKVKFLRL